MTQISQITFSGEIPEGMFIQVVPTNDPADEISFNYNITEFPGGPDVTLNHGINLTRGGDAKYSAEPSIGLMFEKNFKPTPNESYSEWYATWGRPGYGQQRPIAFRLDNNTGDAIGVFNLTELHCITPNGHNYLGINEQGLYLSFEPGSAIKISQQEGLTTFGHDGNSAGLMFNNWQFLHLPGAIFYHEFTQLYHNLEWDGIGDIGRPGHRGPRNIYAMGDIHATGKLVGASIVLYDTVTNQPYSLSIANGQLVINPV